LRATLLAAAVAMLAGLIPAIRLPLGDVLIEASTETANVE